MSPRGITQTRGGDPLDKEQALHKFWSSFSWAARDENTVPDNAMTLFSGHYITYNVATAALGQPVPLMADLWERNTSWAGVTKKAQEISKYIGIGGKSIPCDGGYLYICRGTPFTKRLPDSDDEVRRINLNIMIEFLSSD